MTPAAALAVEAQRHADRAWVLAEDARRAYQQCNVGHADYVALADAMHAAVATYLAASEVAAAALRDLRREEQVLSLMEREPPCFDSREQFLAWMSMYVRAHPKRARGAMSGQSIQAAMCEDCTAGYQTRMLAAGRCINKRYRAQKGGPS
ncbi:MAG TPA: hypothetical protein DCY89_05700 [Gammaproteobacteria bacterium]|nr:hypothetical protein [Gammaproteobacteria bacterium]